MKGKYQDNLLLLTDSYKVTHWRQYPKGTQRVFSYLESRGGKFDQTLFFGLQYIAERYLVGKVVTQRKIEEAEEVVGVHLGDKALFNRAGWEQILDVHDGRLPITIRAVPEGLVVPTKNVLVTVENTDDRCYWLTNYLETLLLQVWYPTTVATLSMNAKKTILQHLRETGDERLVDFKLQDFGFRGVSSVESAAIGGAAHLVNFKGTDTMDAVILLRQYYNEKMAGFSIPAAEHSTITSWGRENERLALENMLRQFPKGAVAVVSDSFDIFKACAEIWGGELREMVLGREGLLVVRPDSGDPVKVVERVLYILGEKLGTTLNDKGYKLLNEKIRVIQGDGVDLAEIKVILQMMKERGWAADNLTFGMGGGLLQKLDRDTQKFAFKCSNITIEGVEREVYKDPVTDPGKKSKLGRIKLIEDGGEYKTVTEKAYGEDVLREVFRDGRLLTRCTLKQARQRATEGLERVIRNEKMGLVQKIRE